MRITKKQLQDRVREVHAEIDRIFGLTDADARKMVEEKWTGIKVVNPPRDELLKVILKGLVSEHFHPGP
jgi:hypothetical protein